MFTQAGPDESLRPALDALAARDSDLGRVYAACGLPTARWQDPGFAGLARTIAAQQLANAAAAAIVERLEREAGPLTPERARELDDATARRVGLSANKLRAIRGVADAVASGALDLDALAEADPETARRRLVAFKGVGPWTADIHLLFGLERPDVLPSGDLALRAAAARVKGLPERPGAERFRELAEPWRPHRSAAAKLLWHIHRHPDSPV